MNLNAIMLKELTQRKVRSFASLMAIFLGITIIVAVQSISVSSKESLAEQLRYLGGSVFVLPRQMSLTDYYQGRFGTAVMPQHYAAILVERGLFDGENVAPVLSSEITLQGERYILTGVLPDKNLKLNFSFSEALGDLAPHIRELSGNQALIGGELADQLDLVEEGTLMVKGIPLTITKILPKSGTLDDIKVFAPLPTVQGILGVEGKINEIKLMSNEEMVEDLSRKIESLLPGTRPVTVKQIVDIRKGSTETLKRYSLILFVIIMLIGVLSIANYMEINVRERRREIGTLVAIGATPGMVLHLLFQKAVSLGVIGGLLGYLVGAGLALLVGPRIVKAEIKLVPLFLVWSLITAILVCVLSSLLPARKAVKMDPAEVLNE